MILMAHSVTPGAYSGRGFVGQSLRFDHKSPFQTNSMSMDSFLYQYFMTDEESGQKFHIIGRHLRMTP